MGKTQAQVDALVLSTQHFSKKQKQVIDMPSVTFEGIDAMGRPVVSRMSGNPQRRLTWALKKDGDPIDIVTPVEPYKETT